jgi:hypothetical protein
MMKIEKLKKTEITISEGEVNEICAKMKGGKGKYI